MTSDPDTARRAVASQMPAALARAMDQYDQFAALEPPQEAKAFANFQAGCKAALAHVETALKLLEQAAPSESRTPPDAAEERAALGELVREARTAVARLRTGG